ncbi:hypothetical protein CLU79DRAFT_759648 [Phycomyces nitens]|nr:hypothetical protein CLU79DRAFT_759648 [Phycomyces nitens]
MTPHAEASLTINTQTTTDQDTNQPSLKRKLSIDHPQRPNPTQTNRVVLATDHESRPVRLEPPKRQTIQSTQPRWHSQSYMVFLALRQHPERSLPRTDLIRAALALDKKISEERHLPRVFRGKTPMNSASAILTYNSDRYFVPFKPEGSRSTHFRLAYEPGNFSKAVQEYRKWEKKLAEHDWPYCFGEVKPSVLAAKREQAQKATTPPLSSSNTSNSPSSLSSSFSSNPTEFDAFIADRTAPSLSPPQTPDLTKPDSADQPPNIMSEITIPDTQLADSWSLDELDLTNVPVSWHDILKVDESKIPGAGKGLFATRRLPTNTPIGFYFGVPMTEDEFDSLKDNVGRASEYSIMYRKTVLDATDENGHPYDNPDGPMYCPFHYMNETDEAQANISFLEGAVVNQVICWTKRVIEQDEELFVWYGRDVNRHWTEKGSSIE